MDKETKKEFENLAQIIRKGFDGIDWRLDGVNRRFGNADWQFKSISSRFNNIDLQLNSIESRLVNIKTQLGRLDDIEKKVNQILDMAGGLVKI